jgi:MFS transporter, DHA1 family, multidrug resistance protein
MKDIIRDSTIGQFINHLSGGRYLPYLDQRVDYVIPTHLLPPPSAAAAQLSPTHEKHDVLGPGLLTPAATSPRISGDGSSTKVNTPAVEGSENGEEKGAIKCEAQAYDPYLVTWYGDDDPDNPRCVPTSPL